MTAGPNLRGPVFNRFVYETAISESAAKFSSVVTVAAKDPEGGPVRYAIVAGNDQEHFSIEESTGVIRVMQPLDRESIRRYSLTVRGEDQGGIAATATVDITITDVNDENPHFTDLPYSFRVIEGQAGAPVGRVHAQDDDRGANADIFYSVPDDSPFDIDVISGEIRTRKNLDFEGQSVHYVVVTAKDGGRDPRTATATVTVLVQDTADEIPTFPQSVYEATVPENVADYIVTTVRAEDKDSETSITYSIINGDLDKFTIDPKSGVVRTIRGLDYERERSFTLMIGTEEEKISGKAVPSSTCRIDITVEDRNDVAPRFTQTPRNNLIHVGNDIKRDEVIGRVRADDGDGTAPANIVTYQIEEENSSERASKYFSVDAKSGDISVVEDLTRELLEEYRLSIVAFDGGDPQLSNSVIVIIRVRQVVTVAPETGIGFAEVETTVEVNENVGDERVLHRLQLLQPSDGRTLPMSCDVASVKSQEGKIYPRQLFKANINSRNECELMHGEGALDREENDRYVVEIRLRTPSAFANPNRNTAEVTVVLKDENDNMPQFVFDNPIVKDQYLVSVLASTPENTRVFQVKAVDHDEGDFGRVSYHLVGDSEAKNYFSLNSQSGQVVTRQSLHDVALDQLPFELTILARDNPSGDERLSKTQRTSLIINVLRPGDGIVLTVADTPPAEMIKKQAQLVDVIQEQTGLIANIDQMLPAMVKYRNGTCCKPDSTGTDVYFHVTDPKSNEILSYDSDKVQR